MRVLRYAVVIEKANGNLSAYVPDLPGCVTTGENIPQIEANIREAIELHLEGMRQDGQSVPEPTTICEYVETEVA